MAGQGADSGLRLAAWAARFDRGSEGAGFASPLMLLTLLVLLALLLALGVPVAFALAGAALAAALLGAGLGAFDLVYLQAFPNRLFGIMGNETLLAVPLFVFMGVMLERARIAEELLSSMARLFGGLRGGMALSVLRGRGADGGLDRHRGGHGGDHGLDLSACDARSRLRPEACRRHWSLRPAPLGRSSPSIVLVLLGDQLSAAYQQAQLRQGVFAPETVSIGDLFAGALLPGLMLVVLYALYVGMVAWFRPQRARRKRTGGLARVAGGAAPRAHAHRPDRGGARLDHPGSGHAHGGCGRRRGGRDARRVAARAVFPGGAQGGGRGNGDGVGDGLRHPHRRDFVQPRVPGLRRR